MTVATDYWLGRRRGCHKEEWFGHRQMRYVPIWNRLEELDFVNKVLDSDTTTRAHLILEDRWV